MLRVFIFLRDIFQIIIQNPWTSRSHFKKTCFKETDEESSKLKRLQSRRGISSIRRKFKDKAHIPDKGEKIIVLFRAV